MKPIFAFACLMIGLYSCQSTKINQSQPENEIPSNQQVDTTPEEMISKPEQLTGKKWLLTHINGQIVKNDDPEQQPFAIFDLAQKSIHGFSGCNSFSGNCEVDNNQIKVSLIMSTRRFCEGSPEADFFRLLDKANRFEVIGNELRIKENQEILLTFNGIDNLPK